MPEHQVGLAISRFREAMNRGNKRRPHTSAATGMSTRAGVAVAVLVFVIAVGAVSSASAARAALRPCKSVTAGGKTWTVLTTAAPSCATARSIVGRVAVAKPDQVLHAQG